MFGPQDARRLVLREGWNSTAYQILNPGIEWWWSASGDAVVGYVRRAGTRVVAGAPVCAAEQLPAVTAAFERDAHALGERVCYFGAEARLEEHYRASPQHASIVLGAQPAWHPSSWPAIVARRASLRAQLARARNKGIVVREWSAAEVEVSAALRGCLSEWLATRGLPPLRFLVEPDTLGLVIDRRVFVAERMGVPVGFLVASPVPRRNGWLIEQIIRGRTAPNGTAELMVDAVMRAVADAGAQYLTLGLSPLSARATDDRAADAKPAWLSVVFAWVRAHGRRFYNFDGLDAFKAKFQPEWWEPVFAITDTPRFRPRALYAIAAAFSDGPLPAMLAHAMAKALRTELEWLIRRVYRFGEPVARGMRNARP